MPVRNVATMAIASHITGGVSFNTIDDVAKVGPLNDRKTIPMDEYLAVYDGAFVAMVDKVDWNRVLIEARSRHLSLKHENEFGDYGDEVCGECLCEALIQPYWHDWENDPKADRRHS